MVILRFSISFFPSKPRYRYAGPVDGMNLISLQKRTYIHRDKDRGGCDTGAGDLSGPFFSVFFFSPHKTTEYVLLTEPGRQLSLSPFPIDLDHGSLFQPSPRFSVPAEQERLHTDQRATMQGQRVIAGVYLYTNPQKVWQERNRKTGVSNAKCRF